MRPANGRRGALPCAPLPKGASRVGSHSPCAARTRARRLRRPPARAEPRRHRTHASTRPARQAPRRHATPAICSASGTATAAPRRAAASTARASRATSSRTSASRCRTARYAQFSLGRRVARRSLKPGDLRLLRRARPRRHLRRPRALHPRAAHRDARRHVRSRSRGWYSAPLPTARRGVGRSATTMTPPGTASFRRIRHGPSRSSTRSSSACARDERLPAFAAALPTRARVSEPALPLLLAALARGARARRSCVAPPRRRRRARRRRGRGVVPRRGAASRCFPSRGVRWGSGLEPPPHLVGERARALDVLARGGLVCASAARARRADAAAARRGRRRSASRRGDEPGHRRRSPRQLALAGLRARRAGRGARPVRRARRARRRLPDDRPRAAPDRALRRRDRAASAPSRRSRSARCARSTAATIYPAGRAARRARRGHAARRRARTRRRSTCPTTSCRRSTAPPDLVWQPDEVRAVWAEEGARRARRSTGATELDPLPQGQPFSFDAQRPALAARGLSEAENELERPAPPGPRRRRRVRRTAARRERQRHLLRRVERDDARAGRRAGGPRRSPSRLRGAASSGATSASRCCPDTQVFRSAPPRATARDRPRARELLRPAHGRLRRARGPRHRAAARASRRRRSRASRATTCCSRFRGDDRVFVPHEQIGKVSRYIGADSKAPTLSKLGGKAWDNLKTARARAPARDGRRAAAALRAAADAARASRTTSSTSGSSGSRRSSRTARPRTRHARSRRSRRTSRRRSRWTGSSAATSASARPRSRCAPRSRSRSPASRC